MVEKLENFCFKFRGAILILLMVFTAAMAYYAQQLRPDAGFRKQLPLAHEFVITHFDHEDYLGAGNRVIVAVRAREGDIWNQKFFKKLKEVTDDVFFLPGVDRGKVTSLWTPNTRYLEITEEGLSADDVIPGTITEETIDQDNIKIIQNNVIRGGFVGSLVANDFTAAMVRTDLMEFDPKTQERLDVLGLARKLENDIRGKHEDEDFEIHIIGLAKMFGDVADGATGVIQFFIVAFLLTAGAVYYYSRSFILTFLPLFCSATSLVWQFGLLTIMGYGLDPLAILVPFLVFAIGVSHGIQQINLISKEITSGSNSMEAARASFRRLLIPGSMALITDLVGFGTLWFIPIGMIKELAITASIGVALKIITNLLMLPLAASYFNFDDGYKGRITRAREARSRFIEKLGFVADTKWATTIFVVSCTLFVVSVIESSDRHVGDLHPGAPELQPNHRYNTDSEVIVDKFSVGLDVMLLINETPPEACINYDALQFIDKLAWHMSNVPGVTEAVAASTVVKRTTSGWNEGNPKFMAIPRNQFALVQGISPIQTSTGLLNGNCSLLPVAVFLEDHKATTIKQAVEAVKEFRANNQMYMFRDAGTWRAFTQEEFDALSDDAKTLIDFGIYVQLDGNGGIADVGGKRADIFAEDGADEARLTEIAERRSRYPENIVTLLDDGAQSGWSFNATDGAQVQNSTVKNINIRLASGNAGIMAATNEEIETSETPMMLLVYAVIVVLVFTTYRDWRATICCCLPLTLATFMGYWFMNVLQIGLKVSTLPVMVLAVGIGVDYAFYIYNRLQFHLAAGLDIQKAYRQTLMETGVAVIFTAVTLAVGVSTWVFSDLKFQADMGALLTFMFLINMIGAITTLPALAVLLDIVIPRRGPVKATGTIDH